MSMVYVGRLSGIVIAALAFATVEHGHDPAGDIGAAHHLDCHAVNQSGRDGHARVDAAVGKKRPGPREVLVVALVQAGAAPVGEVLGRRLPQPVVVAAALVDAPSKPPVDPTWSR